MDEYAARKPIRIQTIQYHHSKNILLFPPTVPPSAHPRSRGRSLRGVMVSLRFWLRRWANRATWGEQGELRWHASRDPPFLLEPGIFAEHNQQT